MNEGAEPRQIGTYEVLAKLADGGVGTVYLARRRGPAEFQRLVAIKRLHPQFAQDPGFVTMFTDEARLSARIHHANVVSIVELGSDDDGYFVVMEYVEGSNLSHFHWHATRSDRKMPRPVALRIVLDALSGLHAAHEIEDDDGTMVNLVHRDVSPQNILLGMDGVARLGDFGIARAEALRAFETRGPALKGKLEYMAPEQIECKPVDRTTDLFAMGIVLWELLTGRRLFPAANQVTTIQRVCFDPIPSPRSVDPTVSAELDRICLRALERPRAKRYPTAAAFAEDLEKAARADGGIATQREVAACMISVLGSDAPAARSAARERGRGAAPVIAIPDLGAGLKGKASTYQLPASDPMIKLPAGPILDATLAHPEVSGEMLTTEPYGPVPPPGLGIIDSEPTIVVPERITSPSLPPSVPSHAAPQVDRVLLQRVSQPSPLARSKATIALLTMAIVLAAGVTGLGVRQLSRSRTELRANTTATAASGTQPATSASAVGAATPGSPSSAASVDFDFDDMANAAPPATGKSTPAPPSSAAAKVNARARANASAPKASASASAGTGGAGTAAPSGAAVPMPVEVPSIAQPRPDEL